MYVYTRSNANWNSFAQNRGTRGITPSLVYYFQQTQRINALIMSLQRILQPIAATPEYSASWKAWSNLTHLLVWDVSFNRILSVCTFAYFFANSNVLLRSWIRWLIVPIPVEQYWSHNENYSKPLYFVESSMENFLTVSDQRPGNPVAISFPRILFRSLFLRWPPDSISSFPTCKFFNFSARNTIHSSGSQNRL